MIYFIGTQQCIDSEDIIQGYFDDLILYLQNNNEVGIDTETTGFDPFTKKLLSIQFGDFNTQYFVDWNYLTNDQLSRLKKELEDVNKVYLLQNAKFDLRFLLANNIDIKNVYDTFLAECILTTGLTDKERDTSLKGIVKKYCNIDLDKTIRGEIHKEGLSNKVIRYGANDVKYLKLVKEAQMTLINKWQLENVLNLENEVVRVFAKIENNGVLIDSNKWLSISKKVEKEKIRLESELDKIIFNLGSKNISKQNKLSKYCNLYKQSNLFFDDIERDTFINWSSPSQKLKIINDLGIKISSTAHKDLQLNKHKHPLIGLLLEHATVSKLESSFGKKFLNHINPVTKRIHYNVWQILSTGRISVSNPKHVGAC